MLNNIRKIVTDKYGIEIGGPSYTGDLIYKNAKLMDNVIFSNDTIWSKHTSEYKYTDGKVGKVIINDATDITGINNESYDFIFASHTLEHIANPIKALTEWLRVIKTDGYVILILPEKSCCFDHRRNVSRFDTILKQFINNVGEADLSTLPEILELHDLSMDPPAGTFEQFTRRSLKNYDNRCLHHYVYSPDLLKQICDYLNCKFIFTYTEGLNIWFIMQKVL